MFISMFKQKGVWVGVIMLFPFPNWLRPLGAVEDKFLCRNAFLWGFFWFFFLWFFFWVFFFRKSFSETWKNQEYVDEVKKSLDSRHCT